MAKASAEQPYPARLLATGFLGLTASTFAPAVGLFRGLAGGAFFQESQSA